MDCPNTVGRNYISDGGKLQVIERPTIERSSRKSTSQSPLVLFQGDIDRFSVSLVFGSKAQCAVNGEFCAKAAPAN